MFSVTISSIEAGAKQRDDTRQVGIETGEVSTSDENKFRWRSPNLKDKGQDGWPERRVIPEFLQVAAMLSLGPHGHLNETHQGEEGHGQTLSHQREAEPGAQLQQKEECENVYNGWPFTS